MSEINVPAESLPQMPAAGVLSATDLMYILQGSGLDRDRAVTVAALLADPLFVSAINSNEEWKSVSVEPIPSLVVNLGAWEKNVLMNVVSPPFDTFTITTAQKNAMLVISPNWGEVDNSVTLSVIILGTTYVIPNRHYAQFFFTAENTVRSVAMIANIDAQKSYKVMTCGVSFADDGYRGPQEIIVNPELTDDDGLIMTTANILTYSENSVMKITPDWKHVVAENSLTANVYSGGSIVGVSIPYGCSAEIAYLTNKTIANIAVIPSMNYLIQTSNIKDLAVTANKINTASVTDVKLAASSVTEGKIGTGAVTETKLGTGAVTTDKIANGAATSVKMATDVVFHDGTETTNLDASYPPESCHVGYILVLEPSYIGNTSYSFSHNNSSQSVTLYAYGCIAFICVDAGETYGHQWRPLNHFYNA